jgi:membrane protein YqaA with SNARE-associated domain
MPNFDLWITTVLHWLSVPEQGLLALAVVAFIAASVVPLSSEAVLLGVLSAQPHQFWSALLVATIANTAGSMTTYWLGRVGKRVPHPAQLDRHVQWFERYGSPSLIWAWVPLVGDVLVIIAGWLRLNPWYCLLWIALGKAARYAVLAVAVLPVT